MYLWGRNSVAFTTTISSEIANFVVLNIVQQSQKHYCSGSFTIQTRQLHRFVFFLLVCMHCLLQFQLLSLLWQNRTNKTNHTTKGIFKCYIYSYFIFSIPLNLFPASYLHVTNLSEQIFPIYWTNLRCKCLSSQIICANIAIRNEKKLSCFWLKELTLLSVSLTLQHWILKLMNKMPVYDMWTKRWLKVAISTFDDSPDETNFHSLFFFFLMKQSIKSQLNGFISFTMWTTYIIPTIKC